MDQTEYILVINGKPEGPFSLEELKARNITPNDFVRTPTMADYKQAHEVAELRQLFGFNKEVLIQYYAAFDQRLLATTVDWLIVTAACVLPALLLSLFITSKIWGIAFAFIILLIIIPLAKLVYHIVMESSPKQGTYGKQLLGIKVCDLEGAPIDRSQAAARNFAKIISILTFWLGYLYSYFNPKHQCLHDVVAGTLVIKDRL